MTVNGFGEFLRAMRKAKGYTLQEVGDRVGTKKGYICGIEGGKVNPPSADVVKKLARVLGIDRTELLLLAYIQKAPAEIRGILGEGVKRVMEERKAKAEPPPAPAAAPAGGGT